MSDELLACLQRIEAILRDRLPPVGDGRHPLARWAGCFTDDPDWTALHEEIDAERQVQREVEAQACISGTPTS
jgi:hypothetical protein